VVLGVLGVLPTQAHELGKVQIYATFSKTGSYQLEMVFDKEHLAPAEEQHLDRFVSGLTEGAALLFDDRPVHPEVSVAPADPQEPPGSRRAPAASASASRSRSAPTP
jgi:hypothetical protein